jgi:KUP system potassium uptake protein
MGQASSPATEAVTQRQNLSACWRGGWGGYGDIGTSPLYTLKEVFTGGYGVPVNHDGVSAFWR